MVLNLKINQGVNIQGKGKSIDIIVLNYGGRSRERTALVEIRGVYNQPGFLNMKASKRLTHLTDGIKYGVRFTQKGRGRTVPMDFSLPDGYSITREEYDSR